MFMLAAQITCPGTTQNTSITTSATPVSAIAFFSKTCSTMIRKFLKKAALTSPTTWPNARVAVSSRKLVAFQLLTSSRIQSPQRKRLVEIHWLQGAVQLYIPWGPAISTLCHFRLRRGSYTSSTTADKNSSCYYGGSHSAHTARGCHRFNPRYAIFYLQTPNQPVSN